MLLSDFLLTRVFEVALHGLDLADALERSPWLTTAGYEAVKSLLFGPTTVDSTTVDSTTVDSSTVDPTTALASDPATVLRKATGRAELTGPQAQTLDSLGLRRLALG
jgi:hypothetical protein